MAFLVFVLLYTPCVAAIATVISEQGGARAALEMVLLQCSVAWVASYIAYTIGLLVTGAAASISLIGLLVAIILVAGIALYLRSQRESTSFRSAF